MTGPEKETLTLLLRAVDRVEADVKEVKEAVKAIETRVQAMEQKDATQVAVAATTSAIAAASNARQEKRSLSMRAWITIGVAATAALTTLLLKIIELVAPR